MKTLGKVLRYLLLRMFEGIITGIFISVGAAIVFAVLWYYYSDMILGFFG